LALAKLMAQIDKHVLAQSMGKLFTRIILVIVDEILHPLVETVDAAIVGQVQETVQRGEGPAVPCSWIQHLKPRPGGGY